MKRKKLSNEEIAARLSVINTWVLDEEKDVISKRFNFKDFSSALAFVNKIGEAADKMDHHPDIKLGYGYAEIELTTHDAKGLTANDFDLAEKIEAMGNS